MPLTSGHFVDHLEGEGKNRKMLPEIDRSRRRGGRGRVDVVLTFHALSLS